MIGLLMGMSIGAMNLAGITTRLQHGIEPVTVNKSMASRSTESTVQAVQGTRS